MAPTWNAPVVGSFINAAAISQRRMARALGDALYAAVMVLGRAVSPRD
jgi:hypothetical protein